MLYLLKICSMKRAFWCFFVVIIGLSPGVNATNTDSIRALLPALKGTELVSALNILTWELKYSHNSDAWAYSEKAGRLLKKKPHRVEMMLYYRNLAALHTLQANFDSTIHWGEKGLQMARALDDAYQQGKILNLLAIGFREKALYGQAVRMQKEAVALFEQLADTTEILGNLNNLAMTYNRMGNDTAGLAIHLRVLRLEEPRGNPTSISRSANNIGMALMTMDRTDEARRYFQKGLKQAEAADNKLFMASACFGFGSCDRADKNHEEAIRWFNKAIDICEQNGFSDFLASNLSILGDTYLEMNDQTLALLYYEKAMRVWRERSGNLVNSAFVAVKMADLFLKMKQEDKAEAIVNEYLKQADSVDFRLNRASLLEISARIEYRSGNYKAAFDKFDQAMIIKDSLSSQQMKVDAENIRARYEMARVEESNARLVLDLKQQNLINRIQLGVMVLATLLALLSATFLVVLRRKSLRLKEANELLSAQKRDIELKAAELDKVNKTKDKFFSIVAHDLKSPFTGIVGFSSLLSTDFDSYSDAEKKNMIQHMKESSEQVAWLLDNLLHWARSQMKMTLLNPTQFKLKPFVLREAGLLTHVALLKKIELTVNMTEEAEVTADQEMLRFVIRNLVSNALKFTYPEGKVVIEAHQLQGQVKLTVSDTGIGMTREQIARLFELKTGGTSRGTADEQGTGLGLILCNDFIKQNGGTIEVKSEPGSGTTFTVTIPAE